jgi:hypothetical protein
LRAAWSRYLLLATPVTLAAPLAIVVLACCGSRYPALQPWVPPPGLAMVYAGAFALLALLLLRVRAAATLAHVRLAVLVLVVFLVIAFTGVVTDVRVRRSVPLARAVRLLKDKLPPGQPLVSLDSPVDCLFSYYYGPTIIPAQPCPAVGSAPAPRWSYFCFNAPGDSRPSLPFPWEEIAALNMDRNQHPVPERVVVVGRRLPAP